MNSLSRAAKMMRDIIYRKPRHEHANNLFSLIFGTKWKRFVIINCFLLPELSYKCFLVSFKAVYEPPVPQHVQRKDHVFQALTLEKTWDLNKNCIIVICDEVSISMHKSYIDMCTNKTVIQRNKV